MTILHDYDSGTPLTADCRRLLEYLLQSHAQPLNGYEHKTTLCPVRADLIHMEHTQGLPASPTI